jgi:hypothetical protein
MTKKKLESIIKKNILNLLVGNYILTDTYVIKSPIEDIVIGFCFERSSTDDGIYIWWFTQPLYIPDNTLHLTFGNRIRLPDKNELWNFGKNHIDNTVNILMEELLIHDKMINVLKVPSNFYEYYLETREKNIRIYEATIYTACWIGLSNVDEEIEVCLNFIQVNLNLSIPWIKKIFDNLSLLRIQKNQGERIAILNQWKNNTLSALKLDHISTFGHVSN